MYTRGQAAALYVAATLTAMFACGVIYLEVKPREKELQRFHTLPEFQLTDQDGQPFKLDELKGKVWLADFVYTTCPGPCPMITAHMARLQGELPPEVRMVSFSTDPANDTPAMLKAYAKKYAATERWTFLTGPAAPVYDLINHGFMLAAEAPAGAPIIHDTRLALVDKTGTVRAYYDGALMAADDQIVADARRLLAE